MVGETPTILDSLPSGVALADFVKIGVEVTQMAEQDDRGLVHSDVVSHGADARIGARSSFRRA